MFARALAEGAIECPAWMSGSGPENHPPPLTGATAVDNIVDKTAAVSWSDTNEDRSVGSTTAICSDVVVAGRVDDARC